MRSLALACALWPASAAAQEAASEPGVEACAQAYAAGQEDRLRGDRAAALEHLATCANPSCPEVVVQDCSKWLSEVRAEVASVRVVVRGSDGVAPSSVNVVLDGAPLALGGDGSVQVLPGEHEFRFEAPGYQPRVEQRSFGVGERDAVLNVTLVPLATTEKKPPARQPTRQRESPKPAETETHQASAGSGVPVGSIVLASVGAVSLGVAAGFGLSAGSDYRSLEKDCAPNCSLDQTEGVSTKALVADIALAGGVIALGAAFWIYVSNDTDHDVAVGIGPGPSGPQGRLRASF